MTVTPNGDDGVCIFDADGALSRAFLLTRGYCCQNGCRNCPYGFARPINSDGEGRDGQHKVDEQVDAL